jgi:hypothetical protein
LAARESTIVICTGENSRKGKNTRRDSRVALSIVDVTNPYEEGQIRGRVIDRRPDPDRKFMDPISHKYTGKPFRFRNSRRESCADCRSGEGTLHQAAV